MRKHLPDLFDEQPDLLHKLVSKSYCIVLYGCFMFGIRLGVPCSVVVWTRACNSFFFFFFQLFCQLVCIYYISRQYVLLGICYLDLFACILMNISFVFIYLFEYMSLRKYVRPVICYLVLFFLVLEKGLFEKVQMPSNKLLCSCLYGILTWS